MPEQLTKHPEVTLQVLRSAGAQCGAGARQQILTACPAQRFCKLPGGELCVYGLPEASAMTQISAAEWKALLQSLPPAAPARSSDAGGLEVVAAGGGGLLVGAVVALAVARLRRRHGR